MRYFLLDKITEYTPEKGAKGLKCITLTDPVMHDHFPGLPILPGALILEGVAQLAGWLLESVFNQKNKDNIRRALFVQADKVKFYATSEPGDVLEYEVEIKQLLEDAGKVTFIAKSKLDGELKAKGILTFHLAQAVDRKEITEQRQYLYKIWTKGLENCPPLI